MRILLVNPPVPALDIGAPEVATHAGIMPPMGLLALASHLRSRNLAEVRLLDLQGGHDIQGALSTAIRDFRPHAAGVTACLFTFSSAVNVARAIRSADPAVRIIMGGHHVSVYPAETAGLDFVDAAVFGEGEATLQELLDTLSQGGSPAGLAGVAARGPDGDVVVGPPRERIRNGTP